MTLSAYQVESLLRTLQYEKGPSNIEIITAVEQALLETARRQGRIRILKFFGNYYVRDRRRPLRQRTTVH